MHDLLIKGGTIVDGTGASAFTGDVAVDGARISAVGKLGTTAKRVVNADGLLVTPGWVDIHTHYDGQALWDPHLTPSSWHGVTTAVMGNCGVGFAPAHPHQRQWMLELMEGVEDIPGAVLAEGVQWEWETFPEYLAALARKPRAIDIAAQIPHAAVRVYVMGERGANREPATPDDMARMAAIVKQAILAGAVGFTTSRTFVHKTSRGQQAPTFDVAAEELITIARAVGETGRGVLQLISDFEDLDAEFDILRQCARVSGRPLSFTLLQRDHQPDKWRQVLDRVEIARADGLDIKAQVACRPIGMVHGLECSMHPFFATPGYKTVADLPLPERVRRLKDAALRQRIIDESRTPPENWRLASITRDFHKYFPLAADHADYEPHPDTSVAGIAKRLRQSPEDVAYDLLLEDDGKKKFYFPLYNYAGGDLEVVRQMMTHPASLLGLGDAGAHCGYICDASYPTYLITHWARDRTRGPKLALEALVHAQTQRNARQIGLADRGALAVGQKADINLIDFEHLSISAPRMIHDLPAGGRRLVQTAAGYQETFLSGQAMRTDAGTTHGLPGVTIGG
jgi:N-acyl-D-aspartate/D-glutamate deacylase